MHTIKWLAVCWAALIALAGGLSAQKYSLIDFDSVQQQICDSASPYYYPALLKRCLADDGSLQPGDYAHLYYGYVYHDQYRPVDPGRLRREREMQELFKGGKYRKASALAFKLVREDPLNADYIFWAGRCSEQLRDTLAARKYLGRWRGLIEAIRSSGDGRSAATAYVVIRVPDEYQMLQALRLGYTSHILRGDRQRQLYYDLFPLKPNRLGLDTLFFNINWSYQYLSATIDTFAGHGK